MVPQHCNCLCDYTHAQTTGKSGHAWHTPFRSYAPSFLDEPVTLLAAHSCALQLPLDGVIAEGGGLSFVLHRPPGSKPEWLRNSTQRDFYLSCKPVAEYFAAVDKSDEEEEGPSSTFELSSDVQRLLEKDFTREAYSRPNGRDGMPEDDNLEDKVERLIQEVEQSTIETLMPSVR